ncbi:MAG: hypothetical protein RMK57_15545 [Bryobacterales bacterium]|nr:hypothetical protein [Bryobacteraceae bacterium]MDW8355936.1 hypothetical protein [Bryobacterales bacterium]
MRTTLNLDDDVYALAKALAEARRISLGEAVSHLARRGAITQPPVSVEDGFPIFHVEPETPPFGPEDVDAALQAEDLAWARQFVSPKR